MKVHRTFQRLFLFAGFFACFFPVSAYGQVTVAPFLNARVTFLDQNGKPVAAGCVFAFAAGTSTPQATYSDLGVTLNANPVILDSTGSAVIYLQMLSYKFQLKATGGTNCATGSSVWTQDNVNPSTPLSTFAGLVTTAALTMQQPTAATSGANQSSFNFCEQGSYWTGAAAATDQWCWLDTLGAGANPTSTYTLTHSGTSGGSTISLGNSVNMGANSLTVQNINSALWVGGTAGYSTMSACLTALPGTGGICQVVPNYTETLAANLAPTKNQHIMFMGPATITMGSFQVNWGHGNDGVSITSVRGPTNSGTATGVVFNYTGTGCAFQVGDTTATTFAIKLEGIAIGLGGTASATARGMCLNNVQRGSIRNVTVIGGINAGQIGILGDGSISFTGDLVWDSVIVGGFPIGIQGQNNFSFNVMGNLLVANVGAGGIGLSLPTIANGNIITADIESISGAGGAVNIGNASTNFGNIIAIYGQGNTWDFVCGAAAIGNILDNVGAQSGAQIATTGCTGGNTIVNPYRWGFDQSGTFLMNGSAAITSPPPNALPSAAAGWKYCIFGNSFCTGLESSTEVHLIGANNWFSLFSGTVANNANSTTPDTAANVSLGTDGTFRNASGSRMGQAYVSGCNGTATASTTIVLSWPGSATPACTNTATTLRVPTPAAGTLGNLRVRCNTGGALAASGVFTVLKNNSASAITCQTGTGTTCNDTTHTVAVAAGDDLLVNFTTQVGETLANCAATFEKW